MYVFSPLLDWLQIQLEEQSKPITDLRGGPASLAASPTSMSSTAGGGAFDSSSGGRTRGITKDRGKIRLEQSHRLFRSLDVTTVTSATDIPPVQVDRLTDSPSSPHMKRTFHRWSDATYHSLPHSSLWSTTFEDDEGSLSCDSLDPSSTQSMTAGPSTVVSSPSPPPCPTPRKRWQSPGSTPRPSLLECIEPVDLNVQHQQEAEELHPRFVCWELPFTPHRPGGGVAKPWVRVQPRMRSEVNPPAAHKCDLKAHRRCKTRSRPSSRERSNAAAGNSSGPDSTPEGANRQSVKLKWTRHVSKYFRPKLASRPPRWTSEPMPNLGEVLDQKKKKLCMM